MNLSREMVHTAGRAHCLGELCNSIHTGKCIRRFGGIYAYCRYFIDRKW